MAVTISWTKSWSASDDGSVLGGADLGNLQTDIEAHSHTGLTTTFLNLTDVDPSSYTGQANKTITVKATEDGLEFTSVVTTDIYVKADSSDGTAGYLNQKVEGTVVDVDTTNHQLIIRGGTSGQILQSAGDTNTATWEDFNVDTAQLVAGAVTQAKLSTSTEEESQTLNNGQTTHKIFASVGSYGFYPQVKGSYAGANVDVQIHGPSGSAITTSYRTTISATNNTGIAITFYAQIRYVTASDDQPWLWVKRNKNNGEIIAVSYAGDHVINDNLDITHPYLHDKNDDEDVILIDNDSMKQVLEEVTSKRTVCQIIHEGYTVDMDSSPKFTKRVLREIDEWGDKEGKVVKRMKTPDWAKIVISKNEIEIKERTHTELPDGVLYKNLKKKK